MVQFNFFRREINVKVVFYGPGLAGKTTTMGLIHRKSPRERRGDFTSIATEGDRTLFFDYAADHPGMGGMKIKFRLFTVPGQVFYNSARKLVLQGSDGIVFVADSRKGKMGENKESWQNLQDNLKDLGLSLEALSIVMQWNKRDMPDIMDVKEMEKELNPWKFPSFETIAIEGTGVFNCLATLQKMCITKLEKEIAERTQKQAENPLRPLPVSKPPLFVRLPKSTKSDKSTSEPKPSESAKSEKPSSESAKSGESTTEANPPEPIKSDKPTSEHKPPEPIKSDKPTSEHKPPESVKSDKPTSEHKPPESVKSGESSSESKPSESVKSGESTTEPKLPESVKSDKPTSEPKVPESVKSGESSSESKPSESAKSGESTTEANPLESVKSDRPTSEPKLPESIKTEIPVTQPKNTYTSQQALELLKAGKPLSQGYMDFLDIGNQTFDKEVLIENISIRHLLCHNSRFKKTLRFQCVSLEVLDMGGLYRAEKPPNIEDETSQGINLPKSQSAPHEELQKDLDEALQEHARPKIEDIPPCNFEGGLILDNVQISRKANFDVAKFGGDVLVQSLEVRPSNQHVYHDFEVGPGAEGMMAEDFFLSFRNSQFSGKFEMMSCKLMGMDIREALFKSKVMVLDTSFGQDLNAGMIFMNTGATFCEEAEFKGCTMHKKARFRATIFQKKLSILDTKFKGQAFFGEAHFKGPVLLFGTRFLDEAHFHLARFEDEVNFSETHVEKNTVWIKARFKERLFARKSNLGKLEMERARCEQGADFIQARCKNADLSYAIFNGPVTFQKAIFEGNSLFQGTIFEQKVNFAEVDFQGKITLVGLDATNVSISWHQVKGKLLSDQEKNYARSLEEYSLLKNIFEQQNRYEDLDEVYYCYKQTERKRLKVSFSTPTDSLRRAIDFLILDMGCGYGTKPFRITFSAMAIILLFALTYSFFPAEFIYNGPEKQSVQLTLANAIYFSIATFTTMGFGDWAPGPNSPFRFIVTAEAFIGIFAMALFVGAFTRKVMR